MNYLEISILVLFIGFLILFYISNMIYNSCIHEKTESFIASTSADFASAGFTDESALGKLAATDATAYKDLIAARDALAAQKTNLAAAEAAQKKAAQDEAAANADLNAYKKEKLVQEGNIQANKDAMNAWDQHRNNYFQGWNDKITSMQSSIAAQEQIVKDMEAQILKNERLFEKYDENGNQVGNYSLDEIRNGEYGAISDSLPIRLINLGDEVYKLKPFTDELGRMIYDPINFADGTPNPSPGVIAQMNVVDSKFAGSNINDFA